MDGTSLAVAFAIVVLPGLGVAMVAFRPGEVGLPTQLATVLGAGYAVVALMNTILVHLHVLNRSTFIIGLSLLVVGLVFFGWRTASPRARWASIVSEFRRKPLTTGAGILFLAVFVLVISDHSGYDNLGRSNPMRYWSDGVEIADVGALPDASLQWGAAYPPAGSKLVFNAFDAGLSYVVQNPIAATGALTFMILVALPIALWAVGHELGFRYTAVLFAVVLSADVELLKRWLAFDPGVFAGESFGLVVAMCGLALGVHALHADGLRVRVLAGIVLGAAAGVHLVPTVVVLAALASYALGRLIAERDMRVTIARGAVVLAVCGAIVGANFLFSRGHIGWGGASGSARYDTLGGRFDPTLFFANGVTEQRRIARPGVRSDAHGGWYDLPGDVYDKYVERSAFVDARSPVLYLVPIGIVVLTIAILVVFPRRLKPLGFVASGLWVSLLCAGLLFSYRYDTYIPARVPARRLFGYGSLALVLLGFVLVEGVCLLLRRARPWLAPVAAMVVVAIAAGLLLPDYPSSRRVSDGRDALEAMNTVRANVPCDARILASQRSGGTFQALAGRAAVTEGLAPFLRPEIATIVAKRLLGARAFFLDPRRHKDYLRREAVDYVVVTKNRRILDAYPALIGPVNPQRLTGIPFLRLTHTDALLDIYRVTGVDASGRSPNAAGFPGYDCGRDPIPAV